MSAGLKLTFELTNLCNFSCLHCFRREGDPPTYLSLALIERVLGEVAPYRAVDCVVLTGGEPTLHPEFGSVLERVTAHGHRFALVTNGWDFDRTLSRLEPFRDQVCNVTLSLDGASQETHDALRRRPGSFRRVVQAITLCVHHGLPVQVNTVVTRTNRDELETVALLAARLGCAALAFGHCQPTPEAVAAGLVLDVRERRQVESDVAALADLLKMEVVLAGDHWNPSPVHLCPQLELRELNVDYRGYLTACCMLSSFRGGAPDSDVVADLNAVSFQEAHVRLVETVAALHREKIERTRGGQLSEVERFICSHCLTRFRKVPDLERVLAPAGVNPALARGCEGCPRPHPDVRLTPLPDGGGTLLDLRAHRSQSLNETGRRIWELLAGGSTPAAIAQTLTEEYEVDRPAAEAVVGAFLNELGDNGLLEG